jgi:DegV family protein with EDD domain
MAERQVGVVCESTACLPVELVEQYAITVVPVPFVIDGTTFHDGVDISPQAFYDRLASSSALPKTSPPEPGAYLEAWQSAGDQRSGVLVVTVAGRIGTFERSVRVAESLARERLPDTRVKVLDSGSAAMGQGFVALAAAQAACKGMDLEGVYREAAAVARRVNLVVALDTLRYLARTSRIPQVASIVSSLLDLKPIIRLADGEVQPLARVRSRQRSLERLVVAICGLAPADQPLHLAVHHARARAEADHVLEQLANRRRLVETWVTEFTPVMGAYCGPGLVGAAFYSAAGSEGI